MWHEEAYTCAFDTVYQYNFLQVHLMMPANTTVRNTLFAVCDFVLECIPCKAFIVYTISNDGMTILCHFTFESLLAKNCLGSINTGLKVNKTNTTFCINEDSTTLKWLGGQFSFWMANEALLSTDKMVNRGSPGAKGILQKETGHEHETILDGSRWLIGVPGLEPDLSVKAGSTIWDTTICNARNFWLYLAMSKHRLNGWHMHLSYVSMKVQKLSCAAVKDAIGTTDVGRRAASGDSGVVKTVECSSGITRRDLLKRVA